MKFNVFVIIVLCILTGMAPASAQGNTVMACYSTENGALRKVSGPGECRTNEAFLTWSITGPQGPQGFQGAQGIEGPTGPGAARVVDSIGRDIGPFMFTSDPGSVLREINGLNFQIHVTPQGFFDDMQTHRLFFPNSNCSGPAYDAYLTARADRLVFRNGANSDGSFLVDGNWLVYSSGSVQQIVAASYSDHFPILAGDCQVISPPTLLNGYAVTAFDLSSWGFVPPFRLQVD